MLRALTATRGVVLARVQSLDGRFSEDLQYVTQQSGNPSAEIQMNVKHKKDKSIQNPLRSSFRRSGVQTVPYVIAARNNSN